MLPAPRRSAAALVLAATALVPSSARADRPCPVNALDCLAIGRFSSTAGAASDTLFATALVAPVALELGRGLDDDSARRALIQAGAVGATALVALVTKVTVRRPRPYTHDRRPGVVAFAARAKGNEHSFFSGHTSLTFAALTSAATLHDGSDGARVGVWAGAGALAAATGVLRIRAGQHFPTDVLTGAVLGTGAGVGAVYLFARDPHVRGVELAAFGLGLAAGATAAALLPFPSDVRLPLGATELSLGPLVAPGGGGLALTGALR